MLVRLKRIEHAQSRQLHFDAIRREPIYLKSRELSQAEQSSVLAAFTTIC